MKSKIKGCTHHQSKVLKMAEGGSVPGKLKTMGPPNTKELRKRAKKNSDGSQQYVRGKTKSERLGTLIDVTETARAQNDKDRAAVERTFDRSRGPFNEKEYKAAAKIERKSWKGYMAGIDAFRDEADREREK
jgi:hypothetical protein